MPDPFLIIVSGLPGAGKTTLATRLAAELKLPLVNKDGIKELLFDSLGWKDREWSRKLGTATYSILYYFIEAQLKAGQSSIVESNFPAVFATPRFVELKQKYGFEPFQIQCIAEGEILFERYKSRAFSKDRHPGHVETADLTEFKPLLLKGRVENLEIGGEIFELDTSHFEKIDYGLLLETIIRAALSKGISLNFER